MSARLGIMALTMLCMSFVVFACLETNPDGVALKAKGQFSTMPSRAAWLVEENYYVSVAGDDLAAQKAHEERGRVLFPIGEEGRLLAV